MATKFTNKLNVPLSVAVWLASDSYDHNSSPDYLSGTSVLKSIRAMILTKRVEDSTMDVSDVIASRMGTAIHDAIEKVWLDEKRRTKALLDLGYPEKIVKRVKVNPNPDDLEEGDIPVYLENRRAKEINGIVIGGKYDQVSEGQLEDHKSTSAWSYVYSSSVADYIKQASIYRWLNPDIITEDTIQINYIFTDWKKMEADRNPKYPPQKAMSVRYPLMTIEETEAFLLSRTDNFKHFSKLPESQLPLCTDEELWRSDPVYKYFSNPDKTDGRCTKKFDDSGDAYTHLNEKGKGVIIEEKGKAKRCHYCMGYDLCSQKDQLIAEGSLEPKE